MVKPNTLDTSRRTIKDWPTKLMFATFLISLPWKVAALSTLSSSKCSNQFVGEVINMADSSTPFSSLEKIKLDFFVQSRTKGKSREYEEVYYPKNGIKSFKVGDTFEVKLKDGLLCSLKKI
jgi:hypothetical protein